MINENEICFIICVNNEVLGSECKNYINRLYLPDGYSIDIITIYECESLASGYNAALKESKAKYKIYLHQDLFIVNRWFLYNILKIFISDENIGMIGMVGTDYLPENAVMWSGTRFGSLFPVEGTFVENKITNVDLFEAVAIDGAIIITAFDIEWREDLFDGFDFYDVSQSMEFRRKGKKVVVPCISGYPWCIHDDGGWMNLYNYNKYRKRLIEEYDYNEFHLPDAKCVYKSNQEKQVEYVIWLEEVEKHSREYKNKENEYLSMINLALVAGNVQLFLGINNELLKSTFASEDKKPEIFMSGQIQRLNNIAKAVYKEFNDKSHLFIEDISSIDELNTKYIALEMYLRRIELGYNDGFSSEALQFIKDNNISIHIINEILYNKKSIYKNKEYITNIISNYCNNMN